MESPPARGGSNLLLLFLRASTIELRRLASEFDLVRRPACVFVSLFSPAVGQGERSLGRFSVPACRVPSCELGFLPTRG